MSRIFRDIAQVKGIQHRCLIPPLFWPACYPDQRCTDRLDLKIISVSVIIIIIIINRLDLAILVKYVHIYVFFGYRKLEQNLLWEERSGYLRKRSFTELRGQNFSNLSTRNFILRQD